MGAEGREATASGVSASGGGAGTSSRRPIPSSRRGLMNKQQSEASSSWRPRRLREPPPPQGPRRGCPARAPPLSSARCSAEGAQVSTGPAAATRAAAPADGARGRDGAGVPGGAGSPRERRGPGSAAARSASGVRPEPPPERCAPARGARGQLGARWARRAGLEGPAALLAPAQPPGSAPARGPLCWRGLQGWLLLCGLFFLLSLPSLSRTAVVEKFLKTPICSFHSIHRDVPDTNQCPAAEEQMGAAVATEMCSATLQKTNS